MATEFLPFSKLLDTLESTSFPRTPAIICNAHITGLAVARSLASNDIPVIAIDRVNTGVAPYSTAVHTAGTVTYPLDDEAAFKTDIEAISRVLDHDPVVFPCMDEWVHALSATTPTGINLPFAPNTIEDVLDKEALYGTAKSLEIPIPETYTIEETTTKHSRPDGPPTRSLTEITELLSFPFVIKPARKRQFEETIGTNVLEIKTKSEFTDIVHRCQSEQIRILAQRKLDIKPGTDRSFASYRPHATNPIPGCVGRPVRYPQAYGTSCAVEHVQEPLITKRAKRILNKTEFTGISETEFIYDATEDDYLLLDINTRPWKWIGLPTQAGINLPYAAYQDTLDNPIPDQTPHDATWVYLPDYLQYLHSSTPIDILTPAHWNDLITGAFETNPELTTAVYSPTDPKPAYQLLQTLIFDDNYYCAC